MKLIKNLVAEIEVWEDEEAREEGFSFFSDSKTIQTADDLAEMFCETDNTSGEAVELQIYTEDDNWLCTAYHVSVDGIEVMNREVDEDYVPDYDKIIEELNELLSNTK